MRSPLAKPGLALVVGLFLTLQPSARANECVELDLPSQIKSSKAIFIGTVMGFDQGRLVTRFQVTESFKGVKGNHVGVAQLPGWWFDFRMGKQYLVFAGGCPWNDAEKDCLFTGICSGTHPLEYARATVEQLRSERSGKPLAPVYGSLIRTLEEEAAIQQEDYVRPLPGILVKLKSDTRSLESRTDDDGVYSFRHVPPGKYQVSAELPPNLELGELLGKGTPPPLDLGHRSCKRLDLYALPTGRISGKIIGPDGNPLSSTYAELYFASHYDERGSGLFGYQGRARPGEEWKPFEFYHLPAGDYILVFNRLNRYEPATPFPRTFYPHASELKGAQVIHLSDGQQILDADIYVNSP